MVIEQSHFPQRPIPWSREDDSAHYNGTIQGESGDDGHFIIHGLRPIEHTLTAWSGDRFFHLEVDLAKPEMRDLSELKADRGRTIQGQAIDVETGQPAVVEGGIVEFRSHDGVTFSRPLEPDGSFLLRTPKCEGTLSLLPNAQWHLVTKRDKWTPARTFMVLPVQRYRPQLTDAQIIADLPQFPHDYKLEPGQFVRRIMAPYPKSREAFFAFAASKDVPQPDWMIDNLKDAYQPPQAGEPPLQSPPEATFVIDAQNRIGLAKWVMHSGPSDRSSCLFPDIGESRFRVDSETRIDGLKPLGDLLFREGATPVEFAAALNQEYQKEPRLPFKVTVHEEVFKTLVIHGPLDSEKLKTVSTLECIPEGYTGRTHFLSNGNGPWPFGFYRGRDLGLAYTLDTKIDPAIHPLSIKTPEPPDFYAPGQTVEEYQKLFSAYQAEIHKLLPAAFKAQLGIDAEIKDVSLPVIEVKYDP